MVAHSKFLQVCRPGEFFGAANRCNMQTGECHFWLELHGHIIDPTPVDVRHLPPGRPVYIEWKRFQRGTFLPPDDSGILQDRCWQNVANVLPQ